jgi:hypothetical protein
MRPHLPLLAAALVGTSLALPSHAAEPDQVTMSLREFLQLYEKSRDRKKDPEKAPRDFSLASARYVGEVLVEDGEPSSAVFTARMRIDVHKAEGWIRAPLLTQNVALQSAKVNGRPASVVLEGGYYTLVTDQRGSLNLELEFATNVQNAVGTSSFSFDLVPSGATEVELSVPVAEDLDFTVANARRVSERGVGGKRVVVATLPPQGALNVKWQRKVPVVAAGEPGEKDVARVYSEVYTLVGVGDGILRAQATVDNTILFAGVDTFTLKVPDGMTLLDVKGAGLRDWTLSDENTLTVVLNYAAEDRYTLSLDMEKVIGEGSVSATAPLITPLGVERSKGWVGVEARGNLEIDAGDVTGATAVDVRTLPASILGRTTQPVLLGYKYLGTAAKVPLVVSQHDDVDVLVTLADQAEATTMFTQDGRRLTSVKYEVRNNRRQFLRLKLPDGAELWSAAVAGRAVQPATSSGSILVPLIRSASQGGGLASFAVEVVYVESGEAPSESGRGSFKATLPKPDVPTTYVGWTVYAPEQAKVRADKAEGTLRYVERLSRPLGAVQALEVQAQAPQQRDSANVQADAGALGDGAAPVRVRLPLEGRAYFFEKLLALDESLWIEFDYKGLKD